MNLAQEAPVSRVREKVTEAEWEARINLARPAYRLVALYGWHDLRLHPHFDTGSRCSASFPDQPLRDAI